MAFEITKPAMLAAVAYFVMAFAILLPFEGIPYDFGRRVLTFVLMLIPIGLSIYSINCMMVGKCVVWSWINAAIVALWVLLFLVAIVNSGAKPKDTFEEKTMMPMPPMDSMSAPSMPFMMPTEMPSMPAFTPSMPSFMPDQAPAMPPSEFMGSEGAKFDSI